jgi:2-isopropylmalate synthase
VGLPAPRLPLGKLSGRHALAARLAELGHDIAGAELDRVFVRFKELADRKKHLVDADLLGLLSSHKAHESASTNPKPQAQGLHETPGTST